MEKKTNNPLDGITKDNIPIENYLRKKEGNGILESLTQRHYAKSKRKVRYPEMKEKHGPVVQKTSRELSIESFLKVQDKLPRKERTIAHLLIGRMLSSKDVMKICDMSSASDAATVLRELYQSTLGEYMHKEVGPKGLGRFKIIDPESLSIEEAIKFSKTPRAKEPIIEDIPVEEEVDTLEEPEKQNILDIRPSQEPLRININVQGMIKFVFKLET